MCCSPGSCKYAAVCSSSKFAAVDVLDELVLQYAVVVNLQQ